ncbi:MAG TPA: hypothetical protein VHO29_15070 [Marmoricola sp.]|nr:hypothetical protein [Marmoricola sp.]
MSLGRRAAASLGAAALLLVPAACGGESKAGDSERAREQGLVKAADQATCAADARAVATPYGGQFPDGWPFPPGTTVYDVEDRGVQGTIATAISTAPFRTILDFLNHEVVAAGFRVESGETEAHDAEAEWEGNGHRGRWAIRESAQCPGETVIQVLAARSG